MPNPPALLYVDEDVSVVLAAILKARGFEAVTARESGESILNVCIRSGWDLGGHTQAFSSHDGVHLPSLPPEWVDCSTA